MKPHINFRNGFWWCCCELPGNRVTCAIAVRPDVALRLWMEKA